LGLLVGFLLGRIVGGNQEEAAPPTPPARTVAVEKPVPVPEKTVTVPEKTVRNHSYVYGYSLTLIIDRHWADSDPSR
jgi:hypothetical protein